MVKRHALVSKFAAAMKAAQTPPPDYCSPAAAAIFAADFLKPPRHVASTPALELAHGDPRASAGSQPRPLETQSRSN